MEFGTPLRFVGLMNLTLILPNSIDIQGRKPYLHDFVKKNPYNLQRNKQTNKTTNNNNNKKTQPKKTINFGLYLDIYRSISYKLAVMIETTKLYSLNALTFTQGHDCMRNRKCSLPIFSKILLSIYLAITWFFVEAHAKFASHD